MAQGAIGWKSSLGMVRIRSAVEVFLMASHAGCRRSCILVVGVALDAGQGCVVSGQCKTGFAVIEGCALPTGGAVAGRAVLREPCGGMIRVLGVVEIRQVAGHALCGSSREDVVHVALRAVDGGVRACQRELRLAVVEGGSQPTGGGVAGLAILRKTGCGMVGVAGAVKIREMAGDALRRRAGILIIRMTL